jgi:glycosyltransferase involved in cell wall biosynthesis
LKIGFVLAEHPLDVRIKKEARTLAAAGHEVVALLQDQKANQKLIEADAITVDTYAAPEIGELARGVIFFRRVAFMHIPIEDRIEEFARKHCVDVLHVHDLPNIGPTIRASRRLGIPVVADIHENFPAAVRAWTPKLKPHQWVTTSPTIWYNYQERCLQRADQVIVVIEENRDLVIRQGIIPEKVHIVANYVDLDYLSQCSKGSQAPPEYRDRFVVSYIGGLGPHRGVDVAIRAMVEVAKKASDVLLLIIGNEGEYSNYLGRLIKELGVEDCVQKLGWQPFEKVPDYVAASSVGLIPHQRNPQCDNTIPNKIFDYMGFSKPIIVSDCPPLARITSNAESGLIFRADRPDDLADCILRLRDNPDFARQCSKNGAAAVQSKYNWDNAAAELVKVYEILGTSG